MKKILLLISAVSVFTSHHIWAQDDFQKNIRSVPIGFQVHDAGDAIAKDVISGNHHSLIEKMQENGLVVIFSSNTCPYVIKNIERTKQVLEFVQEQNVGFIILNSNEAQRNDADAEDAMIEYASNHGYDAYYVDDNSAIANIFGATKTPEVFYFNSEGILVYKGAMDDSPANPTEAREIYLLNAIENTINGEEVNPTESKSIGCTIKRSE